MTDPPPSGRCRLGIVGCGAVTTGLHLPALAHVPEVEVVALCDANPERAREAAARFGVAHAHGDPAALLARDDVDAIAVCTPPDTHADLTVAVLASGRHVLVEKPLALTLAECDRIAAHAAPSPGHVVVGFNLRQHRLVREARARIAAGALGRITMMHSTFTTDARPHVIPGWRAGTAGDVLLDMGVHHFDLWRHLTGIEFDDVSVVTRRGDGPCAAAVLARGTGDVLASALLSTAARAASTVEILGDAGRLRLSLYNFDGLRITPVPGPPEGIGARACGLLHTLARLPAGLTAARRGGDFVDSFRGQWRAFARTVLEGRPPAATLEDGRRAVAIATAGGRRVVA